MAELETSAEEIKNNNPRPFSTDSNREKGREHSRRTVGERGRGGEEAKTQSALGEDN